MTYYQSGIGTSDFMYYLMHTEIEDHEELAAIAAEIIAGFADD